MPTPDGFVIWTRVPKDFRADVPNGRDIEVRYEISKSQTFSSSTIVQSGSFNTTSDKDFTVKVAIEGLQSDKWYYYRFTTTSGYQSVVGRGRTAPAEGQERELKIATVSCQSFSAGYYSAYLSLATQQIDYILHLGDHIYERDSGRTGSPDPLGGRACASLSDYRRKYRQYLSDPAYREARRLFTWVDIWDDHEVFNDWNRTSISADQNRFTGAFQAFVEYMPVKAELGIGTDGNPRVKAYQVLKLGSLVELFLLDQRQYRDIMPCDDDFRVRVCDAAAANGRTMLGTEQKTWLKGALQSSQAKWRVLLSEVMISQFNVPAPTERIERQLKQLFHGEAESLSGFVLNLDSWDGFPAERREILDFIAQNRIENVVAVTGDIHSAYDSVLWRDPADSASGAVAVEVVGAAISSWPLAGSLARAYGDRADQVVRESNPQFRWFDLAGNGYTVLSFTADGMTVDHIRSRTTTSATVDASTVRSTRVASGTPEFA